MKTLTVRTNDALLAKAVRLWFEETKNALPDGAFILSDLDSVKKLDVPGEVTVSRRPGADLERPLSLGELKEAFCARPRGARLLPDGGGWTLDGERLSLTPLEGRILAVLYGKKTVCSASEIAAALGEDLHSNKIAVYISYLRKKVVTKDGGTLIRTVHGKGYEIVYE
ncbi:MAG: winged helix-turn-helix transcriptional regulator [Clostridia bacterium]|nr:winged helix-turn-helix transcriptional regulator [Clostridia bacterium]